MWSTATRLVPMSAPGHLDKVPAGVDLAGQDLRLLAVGQFEEMVAMIHGAVIEYENGEMPEARSARDADKLECLFQAREYQDQGHQNLQPWIDCPSLASTP